MGLLDAFNNDSTRFSLGLLAAAAPRKDNAGFGERVQEALDGVEKNRLYKQKLDLQQMQMDAYRTQAEQAAKLAALPGQFMRPATAPQEITQTVPYSPDQQTSMTPGKPASFDFNGYANALAGFDPAASLSMQTALNPAPKFESVAPGASLVRVGRDGTATNMFTAPEKAEKAPSAVQEYEYAKAQGYAGTFEQWELARKRAGATNIGLPKIEIKTGESFAGQVGPMAKDSRVQAQGAVRMFDAADRIEKAIATGAVSAGPMTAQIQTVKQLVQKISGGNDEGIRQTGQAMRSLAQMAVEARKQLQGQGQVTDSEAKSVAKADSGDINELTIGELRDLVTLTKRASHLAAKAHQELLTGMNESPSTAGLAKFYNVPGMETLLKHSPQLPQIGAAPKGGVPSMQDIDAELARRRGK